MAREKRPVPPAYELASQEEMTVVVVKFKGGPESMQRGFDAVNNAIAALRPAHPGNRVIVQRTPSQIHPPPPQNGHGRGKLWNWPISRRPFLALPTNRTTTR